MSTEFIALMVGAINLIATVVAVTWKLSRVELALREAISCERDATSKKFDQTEREFGEGLRALREKIGQFEIWSRDIFVRRDEVDARLSRLESKIDGMATRVDARLERMEEKLIRN